MDDSLRQQALRSRERVIAGELQGGPLSELLSSIPYIDRDAFVDELLDVAPPPADVELPPGAVPYLPCAADDVLAFVRELPVGAGDELLVLGSGLGRAAMLAHLLSGARTHGIEIQAHLVERARRTSAQLRLDVAFERADFTEVELDASAVFLYAPCNGAMLASLTDRLAVLARRQRIAIGAVGVELAVPGLVRRASSNPMLSFYEAA